MMSFMADLVGGGVALQLIITMLLPMRSLLSTLELVHPSLGCNFLVVHQCDCVIGRAK